VIATAEQRVEPSQALKAARIRDLRHRQPRVGQQVLREQQAVRLRKLDRRYAELSLERSPKLPARDAELARQCIHALAVERASGDACRGRLSESRNGVDSRESRRELRAAAQARSISGALRGGRIREEATVSTKRGARGADRPAVDPRRRDPDEEHAVESGVPRLECARAAVPVERSHERENTPEITRPLAVFGHTRKPTGDRRPATGDRGPGIGVSGRVMRLREAQAQPTAMPRNC